MYVGTGRVPRIAHVAMEFDSHLALVRAGLGIALVPRLGRASLTADLVAVPATDPVPSRTVLALHRRSMSDSRRTGTPPSDPRRGATLRTPHVDGPRGTAEV
ncbi:LysR substrate-binding domain-containing protein [Nocardioides panacis]|uniref:LysR substrate-binding domain-containing protein n=1 Tax=Nocardioides panacis TaxID=2849501 RepID=UPI0020B3042F|nr:LysR substrate-binding domain-containing protein [Nocardioides panacis]